MNIELDIVINKCLYYVDADVNVSKDYYGADADGNRGIEDINIEIIDYKVYNEAYIDVTESITKVDRKVIEEYIYEVDYLLDD